MANPSLQIGNSNWAIKEDNLLGYSTAGTRFVPQPITMTRASAGTRVNSSGLVETVELLGSELVDLSSFIDATNWAINGSEIVASGTTALFKQPFTLGTGKTFKITIVVDSLSSGNFEFWVGGYSNDTPTISSADTYTYYVTSGGSELYMGFNPHSNLIATISSISVKESTKNNLARVDYDGTASSLLVEPMRTNLLEYSEDFSQSYWTKQSNITPTYNTTETLSPDGTYNATKLVGNGTDGIYRPTLNITGVVARSVYLKSVTGTVNVKLKDPNTTVASPTLDVTTEWQRFELTEDNGTSTQGIWIDDIPASGIYIYGAQVEGSYATSYIPTDGGTVTRVQDQYSKTGISNLINSEEGVLFAEIAALSDDSTDKRITLGDGTSSNRIIIGYNAQDKIQIFFAGTSGSFTPDYVIDITQYAKIAVSWSSTKAKFYVNGSPVLETLGDFSFAADTLTELLFDNGTGSFSFFGKVKQLQVFKTADIDLAALTS